MAIVLTIYCCFIFFISSTNSYYFFVEHRQYFKEKTFDGTTLYVPHKLPDEALDLTSTNPFDNSKVKINVSMDFQEVKLTKDEHYLRNIVSVQSICAGVCVTPVYIQCCGNTALICVFVIQIALERQLLIARRHIRALYWLGCKQQF